MLDENGSKETEYFQGKIYGLTMQLSLSFRPTSFSVVIVRNTFLCQRA